MGAKVTVTSPINFQRVTANTSWDVIFNLNYFEQGSTSATFTVKLSDTPDFASFTTFTPSSFYQKAVGAGTWNLVSASNTITQSYLGNDIKYTFTFPNETKVKYLKICITEGASVYETNPILVSSCTNTTFNLTTPITTSYMPTKVKVQDRKKVVNPATTSIVVRACNNALDASPTWEDVTNEYNNGTFHVFTNKTKTAANWAVNVQYTISKSSSTSQVEIEEIYLGYA